MTALREKYESLLAASELRVDAELFTRILGEMLSDGWTKAALAGMRLETITERLQGKLARGFVLRRINAGLPEFIANLKARYEAGLASANVPEPERPAKIAELEEFLSAIFPPHFEQVRFANNTLYLIGSIDSGKRIVAVQLVEQGEGSPASIADILEEGQRSQYVTAHPFHSTFPIQLADQARRLRMDVFALTPVSETAAAAREAQAPIERGAFGKLAHNISRYADEWVEGPRFYSLWSAVREWLGWIFDLWRDRRDRREFIRLIQATWSEEDDRTQCLALVERAGNWSDLARSLRQTARGGFGPRGYRRSP
jgi:hypothetical protein